MRFITGTTGNDTLLATTDDDSFVFSQYAKGSHAISGFNPLHDLVVLSKASFPDFAAVHAHIKAVGTGSLIQLDALSTLSIAGIAPTSLHAGNFNLV